MTQFPFQVTKRDRKLMINSVLLVLRFISAGQHPPPGAQAPRGKGALCSPKCCSWPRASPLPVLSHRSLRPQPLLHSTRPQRGPGAQRQPRPSKAARRGLAHSAIKEPNGDFPSPAHIHTPGSGSMPQPEGADGPTAVLGQIVPGNWFHSLLQDVGMELVACLLAAS